MKNKRKKYSVIAILLIIVAIFYGFKVFTKSWGIRLSSENNPEQKVEPSGTPAQITFTRTTRL